MPRAAHSVDRHRRHGDGSCEALVASRQEVCHQPTVAGPNHGQPGGFRDASGDHRVDPGEQVGRVTSAHVAEDLEHELLASPVAPARVRVEDGIAAANQQPGGVVSHAPGVGGGSDGASMHLEHQRERAEPIRSAEPAPDLRSVRSVPGDGFRQSSVRHQLVEAVRYQPLIEVLEAPQPAALTVVCEGRASSTRAEFNVDFDVTPYPQQAIAARLVCEKPHGQIARQWFSDGEILAFLPLGGPQGNSVAVVWSVHESRADGVLALGDDAFTAALESASHQALGKLTLQSGRAAWPLQLARAGRWVGTISGKGWALAGDAAHTVHPLAGQGLNLGLSDAAELAKVLNEREYWRSVGDEKLLRRYERARKADVMAMGLVTDGLQQLFAQPSPSLQALRNWGMKGFERSGPLKDWVAGQAMGLRQNEATR